MMVDACSSGGDQGIDVPGTDAVPTDVHADLQVPDSLDALDDLPETTDADPGEIPDIDSLSDVDGGTDPGSREPVLGWILLDPDPSRVREAIDAAPRFGINHLQLSHGLVMNIEDLLGDAPEVLSRIEILNDAIALAREKGIRTYVWVHELSGTELLVCYGPDGDVWTQREEAYRTALARIPDVDGVVLMFGSAPLPPWFTFCDCEWCLDTWPDTFDSPPQAERIRLIVQNIGRVLSDLRKDLVVRVFAHEPDESDWHAEGLAAVEGVDFLGMHKSAVNDWQPYNPHDPTLGRIGPRPAILEEDAAGEYWGLSTLPFCAPGYIRYRMDHARQNGGIGFVARIERGSRRALGTPNEVNLWAMSGFQANPSMPIKAIWDASLEGLYGVRAGMAGQVLLREILEATFTIRIKSHYALGIWALDKGSDLPGDASFGQFFQRGDMPKWDPAWREVWNSLDRPDRWTVLRLWQEGTEAVELARESLASFEAVRMLLDEPLQNDLAIRLVHQYLSTRAWRAVDVFLWSWRARSQGDADADLGAWVAWSHQELATVRDLMIDSGLAGVPVAGPGRIQAFIDATRGAVPGDAAPAPPPPVPFGPLRVVALEPDAVELAVSVRAAASGLSIDHGPSLPAYEASLALDDVLEPGEIRVRLDGLEPGARRIARIRGTVDGREVAGGDFWIFLPPACNCTGQDVCVEGICVETCVLDCTGRCPGGPDGCGGLCLEDACPGQCENSVCMP
jgi:hypothetical protein